MQLKALASRIGKGMLAGNLATVLRWAMHGPETLDQRLTRAYHVIDPFDVGDPEFTTAMACYDAIPEAHLGEIVERFITINLDDTHRFVDGGMPWVDLFALLTIVHDRRPQTLLEIGTYFGYTTRSLARHFPETTIHTVDLPESFDLSQDAASIPKDDLHLIEKRRVGAGIPDGPLAAEHRAAFWRLGDLGFSESQGRNALLHRRLTHVRVRPQRHREMPRLVQ